MELNHSGVAEDRSLLGCDTVLLGEQFSIFFKALQSSETSQTTRPVTQRHIQEDLSQKSL